MRKEMLFNDRWFFHRGDIAPVRVVGKGHVYSQAKTERELVGPASYYYPDFPDSYKTEAELPRERWDLVTLPHDYTIENVPDSNENQGLGYLKKENAWYRKHFKLDPKDENSRITLLFEGVSTGCTVYLNGCLLYRNFSAYNSFEVDITNYAYFDKENVLAVYTNTNEFEGWWYQGGGIYRNVWLCTTALLSVDLWGVFVKPQLKREDEWLVEFETTLRNDTYNAAEIFVKSEIIAANGTVVAVAQSAAELPMREKKTVFYECTVKGPVLWSPEQPNLYTVKTTLSCGAEEMDCTTTRIGFRTYVCDPQKGLFINGKHYKINGLCGHQDFGLTGLAVPDNIHRYKVQLMKEMGANGYRTSHYMFPNAFMDALDEQGFIVMDETRWFSDTKESLDQLEMLVKRDRNRPSVFFWSVGNEEYTHITPVGRKINKSMSAYLKKLDNTRPVTTAVSNSPDQSTVYEDNDVLGINYNVKMYDDIHQKYPNKPIFASECCACSQTRGFYSDTSLENGYYTGYDVTTTSGWFISRTETETYLNSREYILGGYQWDAFEHRGESVWPRLCSQSGAIDLFLQKKDSFYQNFVNWTEKPAVHLVPSHWNFKGLEGKKIKVVAYTNCDSVELFLNGRSLGIQTVPRYVGAEWEVLYEPGELKCIAVKGGETVQDLVQTTGEPVALRLTPMNSAAANGRDLQLFTLECVDQAGRAVPNAQETVRFYCNKLGTVVGTGSDVCDHVPPSSPVRKMRAGKITVAVRLGNTAGQLRVFAESQHCGMTVAELDIQ